MKLNYKYIVIALSGLAMASCADIDDQLREGGASNSLTGDQINQSSAAIASRVEAAVTGMYNTMYTPLTASGKASDRADDCGYFSNCFSQDQNAADVVTADNNYNWFSPSIQMADRSDTYANPYQRYYVCYHQIKLANDVIATIDPATTNTTLLQYLGQALAVRAFDYLGLIPYFQFGYATAKDKPGVPIVVETTTGNSRPRAAVSLVYTQIVSDLSRAASLLKGFTRGNKSMVNLSVVYGLRARAELNMGNYAAAATYADSAITAAQADGINIASREAVSHPAFCQLSESNWMWGTSVSTTMVQGGNANSATAASWISSFSGDGYAPATGTYARINTLLYNKIPATDIRKQWWLDADSASKALDGQTWSYSYKDDAGNSVTGSATGHAIVGLQYQNKLPMDPYTNVKFGMKNGLGSNTNNNDFPIMRLEEMYLIKAEGLGMSGQLAAAKTVLEGFVKGYRDPSYSCTAATPEAFQNEVWKQRRIELWGEGFAFNDAMRLGKPIVRFTANDKGIFPDKFRFNMAPTDGWLLMRFPQTETNNNTGLTKAQNNNDGSQPVPDQNPGLLDGVTD